MELSEDLAWQSKKELDVEVRFSNWTHATECK